MNRRTMGGHRTIGMNEDRFAAALALSVARLRVVARRRCVTTRATSATARDRPAAPPERCRPASRRRRARPRIVVLGDSLTAGLGSADRRTRTRRCCSSVSRTHGLNYRGRQRRRVGRHVGRRPVAARLGARGRRARADRRARRQRRACAACRSTQLKRNLAQIIERAQARGITVVLAGMEAPPNSGATTRRPFTRSIPRWPQQYRRRAGAVSAGGRRRHRRAEPARRHPSDGRGRAHRRRQRVDGARSRLLEAHAAAHGGRPGS